MHQDAALRARLLPASPLSGSYCVTRVTDEFGMLPFVRKRAGILKYKNRTVGSGKTLCGCLEMSTQNILFADAIIVNETISLAVESLSQVIFELFRPDDISDCF